MRGEREEMTAFGERVHAHGVSLDDDAVRPTRKSKRSRIHDVSAAHQAHEGAVAMSNNDRACLRSEFCRPIGGERGVARPV